MQFFCREMFDKASLKLGLDKAVLHNINKGGAEGGIGDIGPAGFSKEEVTVAWLMLFLCKVHARILSYLGLMYKIYT